MVHKFLLLIKSKTVYLAEPAEKDRRQHTEDRSQKAKDRGQRSEDRSQKSGGRRRLEVWKVG